MNSDNHRIWTLLELAAIRSNIEKVAAHFKIDEERAEKIIERWNELSIYLQGSNKDIFTRTSVSAVDAILDMLQEKLDEKRRTDELVKKGARLIVNNGKARVYQITNHQAAQRYGRGTKWCITMSGPSGEQYWKDYSQKDNIYFIIAGINKWAVVAGQSSELEVWNASDVPLEQGPIEYLLGSLNLDAAIFQSKPVNWHAMIEDMHWEELARVVNKLSSMHMKHCPALEQRLVDEAQTEVNTGKSETLAVTAVMYARRVVGGRVPKLESIILKEPQVALAYASDVMKERWPALEAELRKYPMSSTARFYWRKYPDAREG